MTRPTTLLAATLLAATAATAQTPAPTPTPLARKGAIPRNETRERAVLDLIRAPAGFRVTPFAGPPVAMYPTCMTSAPDGALYVCVDPNLSLSTDRGRGRVVRLVDSNDDGIADEYSIVAEMDSPRGVASDGKTLYVVHPPFVTAYRDTTGDGVADVAEDLVTGLGFDLSFRGADHGTNQVTLGIDGWLYIAVGDYGYTNAVGKDGATIRHRGGSVVRVRTDGTGLEIYAVGTRNIYDLAVSPLLEVFTRDNTNDGDGWDTRLHYIPAGAHMGYPMYYKNFPEEHMPSLADYGAGAGTGGLWVHDPGFPEGYGNTLYTGDWTVNKVLRHPLTPKGASFTVQQEEFLSLPHPSDLVMDGRSNMYVASLVGGTFTYVGDTVGFVYRVSYPGRPAARLPTYATLTPAQLVDLVVSDDAEHRLQAQRELLRRTHPVASTTRRLERLVLDRARPEWARVAAMFTLKQLVGARATPTLMRAAADPAVRALALRALADDTRQLASVPTALFVRALGDTSARVQLQAITGLVRLGARAPSARSGRAAARGIVPLTASRDPAVAHVAANALVSLDASGPALAALDGSPELRRGALRALRQMHTPAVVAALVERQRVARDADSKRELLLALARLYNQEGPWNGEWWTTRPSFLGPYFAPSTWEGSDAIRPLLREALLAASGDALAALADAFVRERVVPQGARPLVVAAASDARAATRTEVIDALVGTSHVSPAAAVLLPTLDTRGPVLHAAVAQLLAGQTTVGEQLLPLVRRGAMDSTLDAEIRGRLLGSVAAMQDSSARLAAAELFVQVTPIAGTPAPVEAAWRRYVGDRRRAQELDAWIRLARTGTPAQRTLAFSVLAQGIRAPRTPAALRARVTPVLDAAWNDPAAAPSLAQAIRIMKLESQYTAKLEAYAKPAPSAPPAAPPGPPIDLHSAEAKDWIQLWNGRNLRDWDIKFAHHPLGENFNDTFRAEDGLLEVRYDKWTGFKGEFGHIFYKRPFSYYLVAAEYRFVGEQVTGAGPSLAWAIRNNGIMIHGQTAQSMGLDQDFPMSLEVQLLGGLGKGPRPTGNLCTPGTNVHFGDTLITRHCTNSRSKTYDGDQWVRVEALVLGDSIIKHIVEGDTVLVYRKPEMGGGSANNMTPGVKVDGTPIAAGTISLQAETAPIDFRKVEVLDLVGCVDPTARNYKRYFVKSDPSACRY